MELAGRGAAVVAWARRPDALKDLIEKLPAPPSGAHQAVAVDLADTASLDDQALRLLEEHGAPHILVNNTGGPPPGPAHTSEPEAFANAFRQHLIAYQTLVRRLVPGMREHGSGRIINIISTSVKQPLPDLGVSNTIRGAVANWGKTLANELGPYGITVNNVLPGATATERLAAIIRNKAAKLGTTEAEVARHMEEEIPLRRFARPEEIAWAVAFLAGPHGAYINGINLPVDGGRTACL